MGIKIKETNVHPNVTAVAVEYSSPDNNFERLRFRYKIITAEGGKFKETMTIEGEDYANLDHTSREDFENLILSYLSFERYVPQPPQEAPGNVQATTLSNSKIVITWDAVEDADTYEYKRDDGDWKPVGEGDSVTDSKLDPDTEYSYLVRARNADGAGPESEVATAKTDPVDEEE